MPAAGSCRVCSHPDRDTVEVRRASGVSWKHLAHEFALPITTLRDHFKRCQRPEVVARKAARAAIAPSDVPAPGELALPEVAVHAGDPQAALLEELRNVHRKALDAYTRAVERKDDRTIALLVQQLRNNLKAQADIIAKCRRDDRDATERLRDNPEWAACRKAIFVTLARFPDARAALRAALEAYGAEVETDGAVEAGA